VLYYYRQTCLNSMINKSDIDLSGEIDLDMADVQDFKVATRMKVDYLEDRFVPLAFSGIILQDLDEIVQFKYANNEGQEQTMWILS